MTLADAIARASPFIAAAFVVMRHLFVDRHHDSVESVAGGVGILFACSFLRALPRNLVFVGFYDVHRHFPLSLRRSVRRRRSYSRVLTSEMPENCAMARPGDG